MKLQRNPGENKYIPVRIKIRVTLSLLQFNYGYPRRNFAVSS